MSVAALVRGGGLSMNAHKTARLLIVDDSRTNLFALCGMLDAEYGVNFATSGREALESLATPPHPDLILLDVAMPEMDGYAVCDALKADSATRDIPVIFVTARNDSDCESRALAAGGLDFIHKPVEATVLRARVGLHLALRRQARALEQANAALASHRDRLEELVHERTKKLAAALDAAESASRAKSAFLANMSHELRTPINHIDGFTYLLEKQVSGDAGQMYLARIRESSRALLGLIDTMLQYAACESQTLAISNVDFEAARLLDDVEARARASALAKGIELMREIDSRLPPRLKGDPQRLGQVLGQLLDNAVKFSEIGPITLRARVEELHGEGVALRFEVEDRGIGVPPEREASLFGLFEQGDSSTTRRHGGVGLGLALCRRLVSLMGGEIGMTRPAEGGSVFWIHLHLPLGEAPAERSAVPNGAARD